MRILHKFVVLCIAAAMALMASCPAFAFEPTVKNTGLNPESTVSQHLFDTFAASPSTQKNSAQTFQSTDGLDGYFAKFSEKRIGDSFYGWSMELPKRFFLANRTLSGSSLIFTDLNQTEMMLIEVMEKEKLTPEQIEAGAEEWIKLDSPDSLMDEFVSSMSQFVLQERGGIEINGTVYPTARIRNGLQVLLTMIIEGNGNFYLIHYLNTDITKFNELKPDIDATFASFRTNFVKGADGVHDLSSVNDNGLTTYHNELYAFSLDLKPEWSARQSSEYNTRFSKQYGNSMYGGFSGSSAPVDYFTIRITTAEDGLTPESLAEMQANRLWELYNPEYIQQLEQSEVTAQSGTWQVISFRLMSPKFSTNMKQCYLFLNGYKYEVTYGLNASAPDALPGLEELDTIFHTLKIDPIDKSKIGPILDQSFAAYTPAKYITAINKEQYWTAEIDEAMTTEAKNASITVYSAEDTGLVLTVLSEINPLCCHLAADEYEEKNHIASQKEAGVLDDYTRENITFCGKSAVHMTYRADEPYSYTSPGGGKVYHELYFVKYNGEIYTIHMSVPELNKSAKAYSDMSRFIGTFQFQ